MTVPLADLSAEQLASLAEREPLRRAAILAELRRRRSRRAAVAMERVRRLPRVVDSFKWPTTDAPRGRARLDGRMFDEDTGLLKHLGYTVGVQGLAEAPRRAILRRVYLDPIPASVHSETYRAEWGPPQSACRLKKMAESIAAFCRNRKRRHDAHHFAAAIEDWEQDLAYLKRTYYDGRYDFLWPSTSA